MAKYGVIVSNIGTPQSPEPKDVATYLKEFLMDKFVIDIPWLPRLFLVKGIIAPFRSKRSSKAYKKIWSKEGSPLLVETKAFASALAESLGSDYKVVVGMRYGEPSMKSAVSQLRDCQEIALFPQYPQYAESSTRSCREAFLAALDKSGWEGESTVVEPFYDDPEFVATLAERVQEVTGGPGLNQRFDHILFSYHGLPERHLTKIDPIGGHCANYKSCCENPGLALNTCYRAQAFRTSKALAKTLGLEENQFSVSFQSRLGKQVWIPPYTDIVFEDLVKQGVKRLAVVCPSFVADCLETLEEIAMEGQATFLEAGGESFSYIPCPNSHPGWVGGAAKLVNKALSFNQVD